MSTSAELLEQGKAAFQRGEREQARRYVEQALELDPASDQAWLWLAGVATDPKDQQKYLSNALHYNPASDQAKKGLEWLKSKQPELFAPAAATQMLSASQAGFEPPPASYGSGFAPVRQAGFEPPPASYGSGFAPTGPAGFEPPASYGSGFAPTGPAGFGPPPASYGGGFAPGGQAGFGPPAYGGDMGQGGQQYVATPMYGPPGGAPMYGPPGAMPPVYGGAPGAYFVPGAMAVNPRGKNVGCVTAYMIVSGLLSLLGTGVLFVLVSAMRSGSPREQRSFAELNDQMSAQFISIPALAALLAGFTVLYIAGAVGVGKRAIWGWYLGVGVLALNILFSIFTLMSGLGINFINIGLSIFLVSVLVRNREVFR